MPRVARTSRQGDGPAEGRHGVAREALRAGGRYATAIGAVVGAAAAGGVGDRMVLAGLCALLLLAGMTLLAVGWIIRP